MADFFLLIDKIHGNSSDQMHFEACCLSIMENPFARFGI